jgi:hypothetical protein
LKTKFPYIVVPLRLPCGEALSERECKKPALSEKDAAQEKMGERKKREE